MPRSFSAARTNACSWFIGVGAAVKQANMRIDTFHHLAVEFQDKSQDPVRRRMVRPEIDREVTL
jgi:hypothetical protein